MVRRILTVTFLTLVVFLHVWCAKPQAIEGSSTKVAAYTLSTRATRSSYVVGSPVWIEITVKNTSDHEIIGLGVEAETASDLAYIAEVRHLDGSVVPPTQFEKDVRDGKAFWAGSTSQGLGDHPEGLKPGLSKTVRIDLARRFDLSQPGKYVVQVQRQNDKPGAKSNAVTITIVR